MSESDGRVINCEQFIPHLCAHQSWPVKVFIVTVSSRSYISVSAALLLKGQGIHHCGPIPFTWIPWSVLMTMRFCPELTDEGRDDLIQGSRASNLQVCQWPTKWAKAVCPSGKKPWDKLIRYSILGSLKVRCRDLASGDEGRSWEKTVNRSQERREAMM